jgi:monoterpene epsilon-lactone hydrolase
MFGIRPSWTTSFTTIIKILRLGGKIIPSNTNSLRVIADLEVPHWTPTLPSGIKCVKSYIENVDGEWIYPEVISDIDNHSKYILYIHGGAFCMCKAGTHRGLLYRLAKKTNTVIYSVDYKRSPEYKYPIPLEDCLISYMYLLEKVKEPNKIIIAGDSAGGNLVINLVSKLIENNLPLPMKIILISPWVDLTDYGKNSSWKKNCKYDFIREDLAKHFSIEYIDPSVNTLRDVSPIFIQDNILNKFPPILIEFGECEVLHDQILAFCKKIEKLNVNIKYNCHKDMIHVFPLFHFTGISQSNIFFTNVKKFIE